ncbi:MAG: MMPL family transporter, partial [Mycobacteriaceae bacterium]
FAFSDIVMMKYIAFGMIAALIIDATIIRMLLVPAVMYLLREDCWWAPKWITRLSQKIGHNERLEGFSSTETEAAPAEPAMAGASAVQSRGPVPEPAAGSDDTVSPDTAGGSDSSDGPRGAHSGESASIPFDELMRRLERERPDRKKGD